MRSSCGACVLLSGRSWRLSRQPSCLRLGNVPRRVWPTSVHRLLKVLGLPPLLRSGRDAAGRQALPGPVLSLLWRFQFDFLTARLPLSTVAPCTVSILPTAHQGPQEACFLVLVSMTAVLWRPGGLWHFPGSGGVARLHTVGRWRIFFRKVSGPVLSLFLNWILSLLPRRVHSFWTLVPSDRRPVGWGGGA